MAPRSVRRQIRWFRMLFECLWVVRLSQWQSVSLVGGWIDPKIRKEKKRGSQILPSTITCIQLISLLSLPRLWFFFIFAFWRANAKTSVERLSGQHGQRYGIVWMMCAITAGEPPNNRCQPPAIEKIHPEKNCNYNFCIILIFTLAR